MHFPIGSAYIPYEDKGFRQLVKAVKGLQEQNAYKKQKLTFRLLVIRGSASPDGNPAFNDRLAHQRTKAIAKVLSKYIALPDSMIEEYYMGEDYEGLRQLLSLGTHTSISSYYKKEVLSILDRDKGKSPRLMKQALQRLDHGKVWRSLLKNEFVELRASRVLLFVNDEDRVETKDSAVQEKPQENQQVEEIENTSRNAQETKHENVPQETVLGDNGIARSKHPGLNIKTNLLYDLMAVVPQYGWAPTPNLSIEYLPVSGHVSPVAEVMWSGWRNDHRNKTWIIHDFLLEGRYYIHEAQFTGHYFSIYANMGVYDIQFSKTKGWLSDKYSKNWGCGLGWGYVRRFAPNSRWKWEVNAALGYLHSKYDGYHDAEKWAEAGNVYFDWHENPVNYLRYHNRLNYIGVTRLGVSLSYDIF